MNDDQKPVELIGIDTEEVSIVDRAANGRRFLIVKNEDGKMGDEKDSGAPVVAAEKAEKPTEATEKAADAKTDAKADAKAEGASGEPVPAEKAAESKSMPEGMKDEDKAKACADDKRMTEKADVPMHMSIMREKVAAVSDAVNKLLASLDSMGLDEANDMIDSVHSVLWNLQTDMRVVKLAKEDDTDAAREELRTLRATVEKSAKRVEAYKAKFAIEKAVAGIPRRPVEKSEIGGAGIGLREIGDAIRSLGDSLRRPIEKAATDRVEIEKAVDERLVSANAKIVSIEKSLGDLMVRVAKFESSAPASNQPGAVGEKPQASRASGSAIRDIGRPVGNN